MHISVKFPITFFIQFRATDLHVYVEQEPPCQVECSSSSSDCLQVQKGRDDVMLEFPADDTAGGDHEDALFEMSFHVPKDSDRFGGEDTVSAAEVTRCVLIPAAFVQLEYTPVHHEQASIDCAQPESKLVLNLFLVCTHKGLVLKPLVCIAM